MPVDNYEQEQRAKNLSVRQELLMELDGALSADGIRHRKRARLRRSFAWGLASRTANTLRRLFDIFLSALLLILLSPVWIIALLIARLSGGGITRHVRLGRWATHFNLYQFTFPGKSISG